MTPEKAEKEDFVLTLTVTDEQTPGLRTFPGVVAQGICNWSAVIPHCKRKSKVLPQLQKNVNLNTRENNTKSSNKTECLQSHWTEISGLF